MSEPITTNNVSEIDDIDEVIGTDGKSKNFSNIIKSESVDLIEKIYDPDDIDVVNNADPISKNCPEVDAEFAALAENPEIQNEEPGIKNEEPANTKKIARKRRASSLLTFICAISMMATVAVFAQAIELAHLDPGDMYGKWITVAMAISVIFHMWAHGYIAKTIE